MSARVVLALDDITPVLVIDVVEKGRMGKREKGGREIITFGVSSE